MMFKKFSQHLEELRKDLFRLRTISPELLISPINALLQKHHIKLNLQVGMVEVKQHTLLIRLRTAAEKQQIWECIPEIEHIIKEISGNTITQVKVQ